MQCLRVLQDAGCEYGQPNEKAGLSEEAEEIAMEMLKKVKIPGRFRGSKEFLCLSLWRN